MEGHVIKYQSNGQLLKGIVKSEVLAMFIVIKEYGTAETVWEEQVIKSFTPPPKDEFLKWLKANYVYIKQTDEWIKGSQKFTESALYHIFLFRNFN